MAKSNGTRGGPGFLSLLLLLFIGLKLADIIAWGWLWVLAPLWIPGVVVVAALLLAVIVALAQIKKERRYSRTLRGRR